MSLVKTNAILDASGGTTATINGYTPTVSNMAGRNRIINGAMVIDQRNAGASSSVVNGTYYLDRFVCYTSTASDYTVGQNLNSVTPPAGFQKYMGFQSAIATSPAASDYHFFAQQIEANNISDIQFGSAGAKSLTLSFWVRSSLTGTFGGAINNNSSTRSYPFSFTIDSANTWEQKSVTIPGDTSGTWSLSGTGSGMFVRFMLGTGSNRTGTVNTWASANYDGPTGCTALTATSGATYYITGVQLEEGSVATPFDFRQYGQELALCQRYCMVYSGAAAFNGSGYARFPILGNGTNTGLWYPTFPVQMRTSPTLITNNFANGQVEVFNYTASASAILSSVAISEGSVYASQVTFNVSSNLSSGSVASWRWTNQPNAYIGFSAEL